MSVAAARWRGSAARPCTGAGRPEARGPHPDGPRTPDLLEVWREYKRTGDLALRNRLLERYLYLVKIIGNRVAARLPRSIDVQDLRSAGVFGLIRAIDNFDIDRGTAFESYCAARVQGAILDELRRQDWVPRLVRHRAAAYEDAVGALRQRLGREPSVRETAEQMGTSDGEAERLRRDARLTTVYNLTPLEEREDDPRVLHRLEALMDRDSDLPFDRLVTRDVARALVRVLSAPERTVVTLYYYEGLTMKEIGRVLGISESRVCQIHSKTLRRMQSWLLEIGREGRRRLG